MSPSVTRREKHASRPSRVSCGGPMMSRWTENTFSTFLERVSTTWKSRPPDTNIRCRLSGSQTGYPPKSVSRSNSCDRSEYVMMPRAAKSRLPGELRSVRRPCVDDELVALPAGGRMISGF